jgi:predicted benzoate:H+ symporter BenE
MVDADRPWSKALARAVSFALVAAMYAGVLLALTGRRAGVWLVLGLVVAWFLLRLLIGVIAYRRVMRRPWPRVRPLDNDDDDW